MTTSDTQFDVAIIGAGIAGCTLAYELSQYQLKVAVFERGFDIACGATRSNSGIAHGGYDPIPGTRKAYHNVRGLALLKQAARDLDFHYEERGTMVVAFTDEEADHLAQLMDRGLQNGVQGLELVDGDAARALEPALSNEVCAALVCHSAGICDPFGMCLAYAQSAAVNGVDFYFETPVCGVDILSDDEFSFQIALKPTKEEDTEPFHPRTRILVNAAGTHGAQVASMVGDTSFDITPRKGEYCVFDREIGSTFTRTIFQTPSKQGKGVLVTPTVEGNILVGPNSELVESLDDITTSAAGLSFICQQAHKSWPTLNKRMIINSFAGLRPSTPSGDFILGPSSVHPHFYHYAAFDSPGLTSAPSVSREMAEQIAEALKAPRRTDAATKRTGYPRFFESSDDERVKQIESDRRFAHLICKCEQVSEAEIVAAIHSPIPARSIEAVRRRTRAGTGRCQGGFCIPLVAQILSRELAIPLTQVCRTGKGSELAPYELYEGVGDE